MEFIQNNPGANEQVRLDDWASEAEASRAVLVSGIPNVKGSGSEDAIMTRFAQYGTISRLIFQTEESGETQRAVVIYAEDQGPSAAQMGAELQDLVLLGQRCPCQFVRDLPAAAGGAAATAPPAPPGGGGDGGSGRGDKAAELLGTLLASGFLLGQRGVATVCHVDERLKVTATLKKYDENYRVSERVTAIAQQTAEKIKQADAALGVSARAAAALDRAGAAAEGLGARALEYNTVKKGYNLANSILGNVVDIGEKSYNAAKVTVEERQQRSQQQQGVEEQVPPLQEPVASPVGTPPSMDTGSTS
eukprot:CAMPEP_0194743518 /NCGR_PEP_ID=MMETSP0296-20130528/100353_1 /TAXON_ID=39354 /ORGANISM="Heterosigma akashiwo, Strain CCMP2393" /LENGTH=304 /DNA_ID=CAMNT_0039655549 /DNA_START=104 /DNA_END=1018 /DNA_ORIENTATION=+